MGVKWRKAVSCQYQSNIVSNTKAQFTVHKTCTMCDNRVSIFILQVGSYGLDDIYILYIPFLAVWMIVI